MKKLGKKLRILEETIESYSCTCECDNCSCDCNILYCFIADYTEDYYRAYNNPSNNLAIQDANWDNDWIGK